VSFATQIAAAFTPIGATYDSASVTRALTWAGSFIEAYTDQSFDVVTGHISYLDPKPYRQALITHVPILDIDTVEGLLPSTTTPGPYAWTELTNYAYVEDTGLIYDTTGEPGVTMSLGPSWPWVKGGLRVTYDYGYETAPQAVVDVACRLAQQYLENPASVMQRRVGDTEYRYSGSKGTVLSDYDATILSRYLNIGIA
jgi:hypothetical protein